jgi:hypothetical protein
MGVTKGWLGTLSV